VHQVNASSPLQQANIFRELRELLSPKARMALRQVMAVPSTDEFSLGDLEKCTQEEMTALSVALKANAADARSRSRWVCQQDNSNSPAL
jgi:hypothetical protein